MSAANIGEALLAKRKERRLDQGRASAEIGVSPSTYRSYERNTQRPSVNVFPSLAKFLGLDIEEFLPLYAATVIFALRPALEKELAGLGMSSTSNGDSPAFEESAADGEWELDGESATSDVVESYDQDGDKDDDEDEDEDDEDLDGEEEDDDDLTTKTTWTPVESEDHDDRSSRRHLVDGRSTRIDGGRCRDREVRRRVELVDRRVDEDFDDEDEEDDDDELLTEDDWLVDEPNRGGTQPVEPILDLREARPNSRKRRKRRSASTR
jgi:transcriptional regulator with XRE-family HTH domain